MKRRRSERAMPGAPRQRWYCSVGFAWKTSDGFGGATNGARADGFRAGGPPRLRAHPLDEGHEPVVVDASGGRDHDVVGPVAATVEGDQRAPRDRRDDLGRPEHRPSERMSAEDRVRDQVEDQLLRRVLDHGDLLEHDLPLGVEVGEARREDHVGHDVERRLEVLVEHARVHDRVVACGRGVQLAAEGVEDLRHLEGRVGGGALEEQVLEEVADAGVRVVLVARPGADPEPDGDGAHRGKRLGHDARAAVERGQEVVLHGRIVGLRPACRPLRGSPRPARGRRGP